MLLYILLTLADNVTIVTVNIVTVTYHVIGTLHVGFPHNKINNTLINDNYRKLHEIFK